MIRRRDHRPRRPRHAVRFYTRHGALIPARPPRRWVPDPGLAAIAAANANAGVAIDATTNECRWDGFPVSYAWAIDSLCARAPRLAAARAM